MSSDNADSGATETRKNKWVFSGRYNHIADCVLNNERRLDNPHDCDDRCKILEEEN